MTSHKQIKEDTYEKLVIILYASITHNLQLNRPHLGMQTRVIKN
jgi:hypothetical protein